MTATVAERLEAAARAGDVYGYHHIDGEGVYEAAMRVLEETALENVKISRALLVQPASATSAGTAPARARKVSQSMRDGSPLSANTTMLGS